MSIAMPYLKSQHKNKYNLDLEFIEPADKRLWAIFTVLNVADIYTTHRGLKYTCVEEANPLLGKKVFDIRVKKLCKYTVSNCLQ